MKLKKLQILEWVALCVEGTTAAVGATAIIERAHPVVTLTILGLGAIATKTLLFLQRLKTEKAVAAAAEPLKPIERTPEVGC